MGVSEKKFTKAMVMTVGVLGFISTAMLLNDPPSTTDLKARRPSLN